MTILKSESLKVKSYLIASIVLALGFTALTIFSAYSWSEYSMPFLLIAICTYANLGLISKEDKNSLKNKVIQVSFKVLIIILLIAWTSIHKNLWGIAYISFAVLISFVEFFIFKTKVSDKEDKIDAIYLLVAIIVAIISLITYAIWESIGIVKWAFILETTLTSTIFNLSSYKRVRKLLF